MPERPLYLISSGLPHLADSVGANRSGVKRVGELADVTATPVPRSSRRIQYWTFGEVGDLRDRRSLAELPLVYDLTFINHRAVDWERPKTHGHVHAGSGGRGFAEIYEVLEGRAGILIQDLLPGPVASFAVLVEAEPGERVVIPPLLHHATINLGPTTLALADVAARAARDEYTEIRRARGMAYYLSVDGSERPNPAYASVAPLIHVRAPEWSDAPPGPLYTTLLSEPERFDWLADPDLFPDRFPELWARYVGRPDPH